MDMTWLADKELQMERLQMKLGWKGRKRRNLIIIHFSRSRECYASSSKIVITQLDSSPYKTDCIRNAHLANKALEETARSECCWWGRDVLQPRSRWFRWVRRTFAFWWPVQCWAFGRVKLRNDPKKSQIKTQFQGNLKHFSPLMNLLRLAYRMSRTRSPSILPPDLRWFSSIWRCRTLRTLDTVHSRWSRR